MNTFKAYLVAGSMVYIPQGYYVGVGGGPQAIEENVEELMSGVIATCMPKEEECQAEVLEDMAKIPN